MTQHAITGENKRIADSLRHIAGLIDKGLMAGAPLQLVALFEERYGEAIVSIGDNDRVNIFTPRSIGHRAWILKDPKGPGIDEWIFDCLRSERN